MKQLAPLATVHPNHLARGGRPGLVEVAGRLFAGAHACDEIVDAVNAAHLAVLEPLLAQLSALKEVAVMIHERWTATGSEGQADFGKLKAVIDSIDSLPRFVPEAHLLEAQAVLRDLSEERGVDKLKAELHKVKTAAIAAVHEAIQHEARGLLPKMHELKDLVKPWDKAKRGAK